MNHSFFFFCVIISKSIYVCRHYVVIYIFTKHILLYCHNFMVVWGTYRH